MSGPNANNLSCVANASSKEMFVCLVCFALCAKNVLWYSAFSTNSRKCSPRTACRIPSEPAGTMVLLTYLLLHLLFIFLIFFYFSSSETVSFHQDWASVIVSWYIMGQGNWWVDFCSQPFTFVFTVRAQQGDNWLMNTISFTTAITECIKWITWRNQ